MCVFVGGSELLSAFFPSLTRFPPFRFLSIIFSHLIMVSLCVSNSSNHVKAPLILRGRLEVTLKNTCTF